MDNILVLMAHSKTQFRQITTSVTDELQEIVFLLTIDSVVIVKMITKNILDTVATVA